MAEFPVPTIRVLIVDDHAVVRAGLRMLLESQPGILVVGEASEGKQALSSVAQERPDIILLDLDLGTENAVDFLPQLLREARGGRVIVLTGVRDVVLHQQAISLGAMGLVQKEKAAEALLKAIAKVHAGEVWLDPALTARVLSMMRTRGSKAHDPEALKIETLTKREREVIVTVAHGLKNKQIAERLFISETTVRHHLTSIFSKLEVSDRLELLVYALRHGLAEPPR